MLNIDVFAAAVVAVAAAAAAADDDADDDDYGGGGQNDGNDMLVDGKGHHFDYYMVTFPRYQFSKYKARISVAQTCVDV